MILIILDVLYRHAVRPYTHGNVFLRFFIDSSNELVVPDSLENSKQYKNAHKRFRACVRGLVCKQYSSIYSFVLTKYTFDLGLFQQ